MNIEIRQEREAIQVSSIGSHVADPTWVHVDSQGHEHRFVGRDIPTVEWAITRTYWCEDCRDEHDEGEYRCVKCGEVVEPRWNFTGPQTMMVPGLLTITIVVDGEERILDADEMEEFEKLDADQVKVWAQEKAASWLR